MEKITAFFIAIFCLIQLGFLIKDMENKKFVNGNYRHSAEHFSYLLLYFLWFLFFAISENHTAYFCILLGTIVLNYHIYKEGRGYI